MYIIYGIMLYLIVLVLSVLTIRACSASRKNSRGYILVPVFEDTDKDDLIKLIKELYYEESFEGEKYTRQILVVDFCERIQEFENEFGFCRYISVISCDKLCEYLKNKGSVYEQ